MGCCGNLLLALLWYRSLGVGAVLGLGPLGLDAGGGFGKWPVGRLRVVA